MEEHTSNIPVWHPKVLLKKKKKIINHKSAESVASCHGGSYISPGSLNQVEHIDLFSFNTKKKTK